jgi:hypothetical protein
MHQSQCGAEDFWFMCAWCDVRTGNVRTVWAGASARNVYLSYMGGESAGDAYLRSVWVSTLQKLCSWVEANLILVIYGCTLCCRGVVETVILQRLQSWAEANPISLIYGCILFFVGMVKVFILQKFRSWVETALFRQLLDAQHSARRRIRQFYYKICVLEWIEVAG